MFGYFFQALGTYSDAHYSFVVNKTQEFNPFPQCISARSQESHIPVLLPASGWTRRPLGFLMWAEEWALCVLGESSQIKWTSSAMLLSHPESWSVKAKKGSVDTRQHPQQGPIVHITGIFPN